MISFRDYLFIFKIKSFPKYLIYFDFQQILINYYFEFDLILNYFKKFMKNICYFYY